jgi:EAL domain-containing protein (putative c-di-GMP-specific phosphodiesterase class I)
MPGALIPWAEANGHKTALNAWVLGEACRQAARWRSNLQVAVNCSIFQLQRGDAAEAAAAALASSGLIPDRLTVEISETSVSDAASAADLDAMSLLGVQLTVDDIRSDLRSLRTSSTRPSTRSRSTGHWSPASTSPARHRPGPWSRRSWI